MPEDRPPPGSSHEADVKAQWRRELESLETRAQQLRTALGELSEPAQDLDAAAPTFASLYGQAELAEDRDRELVSLATLPAWPKGGGDGHGWGSTLDDALGGGVCPGYMLAVGAASAKAGKTSFVMQLADGLALRTAREIARGGKPPLTPVLLASEMGARALSWRTLARWTGEDSRLYRAGRTARTLLARDMDSIERAFFDAGSYLRTPPWAGSRELVRMWKGRTLAGLGDVVNRWRDELSKEHSGREVWPVVVIDPIQRWQDPDRPEVEALNLLCEDLAVSAEAGGWVVLLTSDTNKAAAGAKPEAGKPGTVPWARSLFRGSYKLQHVVDAALVLRREGEGDVYGTLAANRWGPLAPRPGTGSLETWLRWTWDVRTGRFASGVPVKGDGQADIPEGFG